MPSLKKLNKEAGTNFRRWKEVTEAVKPAASTPPPIDRPESIKREGRHYQPIETLHEWYPEIAKHLNVVPLANMLEALELDSFQEFGTTWIQDIGAVSNGYYTFEHEGNDYDMFLIPTPKDWGVIRDYQPKDMSMSALVGRLEDVLKYDAQGRHIAPLKSINHVVATHNSPSTTAYKGPSRAEILRRHRKDPDAS